MPDNNPERTVNGRYVFQGNLVKDEHQEAALFNELGSSPATLEGSKAVDCEGSFPGHSEDQADAMQAYTQALLGNKTLGSGVGPDGGVPCKVHHSGYVAP